jgi:hypothetical protein
MRDMTRLEALWARLADESAGVRVAGLGHVGLPRAGELTRTGFRTTGIAAAATLALSFFLARGADAGCCSSA